MSTDKKKEMAYRMVAGKSSKGKGMKADLANKKGKVKSDFYTQTGDRPHEGTSGMKARQTGIGTGRAGGEKYPQSGPKKSFKETTGTMGGK